MASLQHGGMATLFLGRRRGAAGFSRHVAIKVVHPHLASDRGFVRMFVEEALLSARIQHPNVVHVEELGEAQGTYFLVMEYVHGCAVSEVLRGLSRRGLRMRPEVAAAIAAQVASGLHAAHETRGENGELLGVVHRDVSPQNILLSSAGHVKLIDFGIAKAASGGQKTATGTLKGKLAYMAPEQAFGRPVDRRTDVYALGIVFWEMLTGRRLFKSTNDFQLLDMVRDPTITPPSVIAGALPPGLDEVVMSAMAKDPDARPPTAEAFRQMLADAVPDATRLPPAALTDLVNTAAADALEKRRKRLPQSMSGVLVPDAAPGPHALRDLTVSSPSLMLERDADEEEETSAERLGLGPAGAVPRARPVPAPSRRGARWGIVAAACGLAVAAATIAAVALDGGTGSGAAIPAAGSPGDAVGSGTVSGSEPRAEPAIGEQVAEATGADAGVAPMEPAGATEAGSAPDGASAGTAETGSRPVRRGSRRGSRGSRSMRPAMTMSDEMTGAGSPILAGEDEFF